MGADDKSSLHDRRQKLAWTRSPRSVASKGVDAAVGARIRQRRQALKMSQSELGHAVGVTFQQIQKYEKAMNRVGASRLAHIADVLRVPVSYLFDCKLKNQGSEAGHDAITKFVAHGEGNELLSAVARIKDQKLRKHIVLLLEKMAPRSLSGL